MLTRKISDMLNLKSQETPQPIKRSSNMLSPSDEENNSKKQVTKQKTGKAGVDPRNQQHEERTYLQLILHESLKDTVNERVMKLGSSYH